LSVETEQNINKDQAEIKAFSDKSSNQDPLYKTE